MSTMNRAYLYIAMAGDLCKIGITDNPERRARALSAEMVSIWRRPYARQIETHVKRLFAGASVGPSEWFAIDPVEMVREVTRMVRIYDDEAAIEMGLQPSPRPRAGEPPFEPPYELAWAP